MSEERTRIDKWLWAARFYKTRALASDEVGRGRISVNGSPVKPSKEVRLGDLITIHQGPVVRTVAVAGLSSSRGPATVAQALYSETPESQAARQRAAEARRVAFEPADSIAQGRPTKRNRRQLADWNRWSARVEDLPAGDPAEE
jgi:ribosome-associated heat shock protein Hsp15